MAVKCEECKSEFKNIWNLKIKACGKKTNDVSRLVKQTYKNQSNYEFSCDICGKNYSSVTQFNHHKKNPQNWAKTNHK